MDGARPRRGDEARRLAALTPTQRMLLWALMNGESEARAAEVARCDPESVKEQVHTIVTTLGVSSRLSAMAVARLADLSPES